MLNSSQDLGFLRILSIVLVVVGHDRCQGTTCEGKATHSQNLDDYAKYVLYVVGSADVSIANRGDGRRRPVEGQQVLVIGVLVSDKILEPSAGEIIVVFIL